MKSIQQTDVYARWFDDLRDRQAKAIISARLRRVELGSLGDCAPVGGGVSELRIHFGPGYRIYFSQVGLEVVLLLAGGDKRTQSTDIQTAIDLARQLKG